MLFWIDFYFQTDFVTVWKLNIIIQVPKQVMGCIQYFNIWLRVWIQFFWNDLEISKRKGYLEKAEEANAGLDYGRPQRRGGQAIIVKRETLSLKRDLVEIDKKKTGTCCK